MLKLFKQYEYLMRYDTIRYIICTEKWPAGCQFNL